MSKSARSKLFAGTLFPQTIAIVGLFFLLIGYWVDNIVMIVSGWILLVVGAGWILILYRMRIYRLP